MKKNFGCVGATLFNPSYEYVVNGMIVDGTPYKDTVVAMRIQHVFFEKDPTVRLSYTTEIYNLADPSRVTFFTGNVDELVTQLAETLNSSGLANDLLQPYTLVDFLKQYAPNGLAAHYNGGALFDLSCATFLVGDKDEARRGFRELKRQLDSYIAKHGKAWNAYQEDRRQEVDAVAALLDGSDDVLRQHILDNVARNARLLGFEPVGTGLAENGQTTPRP